MPLAGVDAPIYTNVALSRTQDVGLVAFSSADEKSNFTDGGLRMSSSDHTEGILSEVGAPGEDASASSNKVHTAIPITRRRSLPLRIASSSSGFRSNVTHISYSVQCFDATESNELKRRCFAGDKGMH